MTRWLPPHPPELPHDAHKGTAGRVLLACGSAWMPGAAILAVRAAQRAGAGLVRLACRDASLPAIVAPAAPETVFVPIEPDPFERASDHAALVGPGLGTDRLAREIVLRAVRGFARPLVLDADALTLLAEEHHVLEGREGPVVVTPHAGEAARVLGRDVPGDADGRLAAAREIAQRVRGVCCLKGPATVVTDGERTWINDTGNPGMATAGSGDVLGGIVLAYLAQTVTFPSPRWTVFDAAARAVRVHGHAGDLAAKSVGRRGLTASDLVAALAAAQQGLDALPNHGC